MSLAPDWTGGSHFRELMEQFAGTADWNDRATLTAAYERHNEAVRKTVPAHRLLEWRASEGWEPICNALDVPIPDQPFPFTNQRETWNK
jgi:hypothetical protein